MGNDAGDISFKISQILMSFQSAPNSTGYLSYEHICWQTYVDLMITNKASKEQEDIKSIQGQENKNRELQEEKRF